MPAWTFNNTVRTPLLVVGLLEWVIAYSSVYVAAFLVPRDLIELPTSAENLPVRAFIFATVILLSQVAMGLYHFQQRISYPEAAVRVAAATAVGSLALAVTFYALPSIMLSREMAFISVSYTLVGLLLLRLVFIKHVDENIFRRRTVIYGAGVRALALNNLRRRSDRRGFIIVGEICAPGDERQSDRAVCLDETQDIFSYACSLDAHQIVVAMDDRRGNLPVRELLDCRFNGIEIIDLIEFLERETGKINVDLVNPGWLIFSAGFKKSQLNNVAKRGFDIVVSAGLLLLSWPLMVATAIAIKIEDGFRASIIYRQVRIGRSNRPFKVLKFRSMREDAEQNGAVWAAKDDSRITRVGAVLRKYRIDELPQMINVLVGQMSLVGPRPERPEFIEELTRKIPYYAERHVVKPGLTGWAQLRYAYGANEDDALEKLKYDLYYVKKQDIVLDLMILLQTVEVVLWGKGAR